MIPLRVAAGWTPGGGMLARAIKCPCRTRFYGESSRVRTVQSRQSMRLRNFARAFLHGFVPCRASGCKTLASRLKSSLEPLPKVRSAAHCTTHF